MFYKDPCRVLNFVDTDRESSTLELVEPNRFYKYTARVSLSLGGRMILIVTLRGRRRGVRRFCNREE